MVTPASQLATWFKDRPKWLQDAAYRATTAGAVKKIDLDELLAICLAETLGTQPAFNAVSAESFNAKEVLLPLRLESISKVQGVNALAAKKPLAFGETPICIVYGLNGAGKSGYVRLLKHACGAKNPGELLPNVFEAGGTVPSAEFVFREDTATQTVSWTGKAISSLQGTDVYDTACSFTYITEENEVAFEPRLLRILTELTSACEKLSASIQERIRANVSKLPLLPGEFSPTAAGKWYSSLGAKTTLSECSNNTTWIPEDESTLSSITQRLAEADPASKARTLRTQAQALKELVNFLKGLHDTFADAACRSYIQLKLDARLKRKAADDDATKVFEKAPLEGVGSHSWRALWEAAREFSTKHAYPTLTFPHVEKQARCVLCQQEFDLESQERQIVFETFVKGILQKDAATAERKVAEAEKTIPEMPSPQTQSLRFKAANITEEAEKNAVTDFLSALEKRKSSLLNPSAPTELSPLPNRMVLARLLRASRKLESQAKVHEKDAAIENRAVLVTKQKELAARKWLGQQKDAIELEIKRFQLEEMLKKAQSLTTTTALSKKKSELSDDLITKAYIERFLKELAFLGAGSIPIELKKTRAAVGRVFHQLSIKGAKKSKAKAADILSEGEFRIISLAAFLADTEGRGAKTPFIFDDPISSLDQNFEEATAQRLVELCKTRQVIVFTHRLSLVGLLEKYTDKQGLKPGIVCLSRFSKGEIAELPISLTKTKPCANAFLNERLSALKRCLPHDESAYESGAKALCRDIRILMEQVIELDLLCGVVRRHNPEIQTKGKLPHLAKIGDEDCKFIDEIMTKFSRYEHSQSDESPVSLPKPDELEKDLTAIVAFIDKLQKRKTA